MPGPVQIQQASSASSAAAPASFTTAAFTATQTGSLVVAIAAVATSGAATVTTPASFTLGPSVQNVGNTLAAFLFFRANVPSGITTVTFNPLANVNGIAVAVYEIGGMTATPQDQQGQNANNSSTSVGPVNANPAQSNTFVVGCEADLTGQAFTYTGSTYLVAGTTATSTVGATNVIIRPFAGATGPVKPLNATLSGTLAGALANGSVIADFLSSISNVYSYGVGGALLASQGAGYAVGV